MQTDVLSTRQLEGSKLAPVAVGTGQHMFESITDSAALHLADQTDMASAAARLNQMKFAVESAPESGLTSETTSENSSIALFRLTTVACAPPHR
jgi:hypothetical protein